MYFREVTTSPDARVDREAGVIRSVRILGPESANNRRYLPEAIVKAAPLYEGRPVNIDHPGPHPSSGHAAYLPRKVADRFGWLEGVKSEGDGLVGDLHVLLKHPLAEQVFEAAERRPELCGLSHNVFGRSRCDDGQTIVEEITRVHSVDLVSDPATTRSLFESMEESDMDPEAAATSPTTADPADSIKWGFQDAVLAALSGEEDKKAKLAKIKALLDAEEKAMAALDGKPASTETDASKSDGEGTSATEGIAASADTAKLTKLVESLSAQIVDLKGRLDVTKPQSGQAIREGGSDAKPAETKEAFLTAIAR